MTNNELRSIVRQERKRRSLGDCNRCESCGEIDPRCLSRVDGEARCYACQQEQAGKSAVENHHIAGQHNSPETVPVPANDHRVLSDRQINWPDKTLRNPEGSPLLMAAAVIRGWLDVLRLIIERTAGWIPAFLEQVDAWLSEHLGHGYWKLPGFPKYRPEGQQQ